MLNEYETRKGIGTVHIAPDFKSVYKTLEKISEQFIYFLSLLFGFNDYKPEHLRMDELLTRSLSVTSSMVFLTVFSD